MSAVGDKSSDFKELNIKRLGVSHILIEKLQIHLPLFTNLCLCNTFNAIAKIKYSYNCEVKTLNLPDVKLLGIICRIYLI